MPAALDLRDAVALLADGRTALSLLESARVQPGERVLVESAAGGVGSLLVQLARNAGAQVVAAAGGERKLALARGLGPDVAVDYARAGWTDVAGPVDIVFDGVGGAIGAAAYALLRPGGRFIADGMASGAFTALNGSPRPQVTVVRGAPLTPEHARAERRRARAGGCREPAAYRRPDIRAGTGGRRPRGDGVARDAGQDVAGLGTFAVNVGKGPRARGA